MPDKDKDSDPDVDEPASEADLSLMDRTKHQAKAAREHTRTGSLTFPNILSR